MKRLLKLSVVCVLTLFVFVSIVSVFNKTSAAERKGHWLYDALGNKNGCQSPGTCCTYKVEFEPIG